MTTVLEKLLELSRGYDMTAWDRRAQQISWAYGQIACMRDSAKYDEWDLKLMAAKAWEKKAAEPEAGWSL